MVDAVDMPPSALSPLAPSSALRRLAAGEAPYPGHLHATRPPTLWVDAAALPPEVWRADGAGHLLAPLDVARTTAGHAAILPHCPVPLAACAGSARGGQAVTIAVSIIRAAQEARRAAIDTGSWWVDAEGRPVLAVGGTELWRDSACRLLDDLATRATAGLAERLREAALLVGGARIGDDEARACEDALFDRAEPSPLQPDGPREDADPLAPRRASTVRRDAASDAPRGLLARLTDAEWAERVAGVLGALTALPARVVAWSEERRGRRPARATPSRPERLAGRAQGRWVVAASAAVCVVAVGMLWPDEPSAKGAADAVRTGAATSTGAISSSPPSDQAPAAGEPTPTALAVAGADGEFSSAVVRALDGLVACTAGDAEACGRTLEDPDARPVPGVASTDATGRAVSLVDEYGGAAVLRVEAPATPAQIVVLVSADGEWLVRDVYDVADQP